MTDPAERIWEVLAAGAPAEVARVREVVAYADGLSLAIRDTFPTYTRHDGLHGRNVLRLMGELLGGAVPRLSGLEAAMLVLAAHLHDAGMVYARDELASIAESPDFAAYLADRPDDYLKVTGEGPVPVDVLENYCRSRHPVRVHEVLRGVDDAHPGWLTWRGVSIREELGDLCAGHGDDADRLRDRALDKLLLGECDLRLCGVLLRLADILDFDASRAPEALYRHLGLAAPRDAREVVSAGEWQKHLASQGFRFPPTAERVRDYPLGFLASPSAPVVEHAVRRFLGAVEQELQHGGSLVRLCTDGWRDLPLPRRVDAEIRSQGYEYGEYGFALDRDAVLRLFMGDDLYEQDHVFVRELLQNAIDACRLASFLGPDGVDRRIDVSIWEDAAGYVWFRIDDDGTGMDDTILREYFLAVGRSYYRSSSLAADLRRSGHAAGAFTAISRFGIGVLSCFLSADRVELSTLKRDAEPLRLQMNGVDDFFVLQRRHHTRPGAARAAPMPAPRGEAAGFRDTPGTSIAVRIDPAKSGATAADLEAVVEKHLFYPPIPVHVNGTRKGRPESDLNIPLVAGPTRIPVTEVSFDSLFHHDGVQYRGPLALDVVPLDLTAASPDGRLRGQLVLISASGSPTTDLFHGWPEEELVELPPAVRAACREVVVHASFRISHGAPFGSAGLRVDVDQTLDVAKLDEALEPLSPETRQMLRTRFSMSFLDPDTEPVRRTYNAGGTRVVPAFILEGFAVPVDHAWLLGHNGIVVPTELTDSPGGLTLDGAENLQFVGIVGLYDELRPDLAISRGTVTGFGWLLHSRLQLAVHRAVASQGSALADRAGELARHSLVAKPPKEPADLDVLLGDDLLQGGAWDDVPVLDVRQDHGPWAWRSARELREVVQAADLASERWDVGYLGRYRSSGDFSFHESLVRAILQARFDVRYDRWNTMTWPDGTLIRDPVLVLASAEAPTLAPGLLLLPPLTVVPYLTSDGDVLCRAGEPLDAQHPFARWFMDSAEELAGRYPSILSRTRRAVVTLTGEQYDHLIDDTTRTSTKRLNATVERLRRLDPALAPPPEVGPLRADGHIVRG